MMEKKEFNIKDFKKSIDKAALFFLLIGLIGIVSIICSFCVGGGFGSLDLGGPSKGDDPKDYYGTYYTSKDYGYYKFEITKDGCTYTYGNGLAGKETVVEYEYEYVSAEYAQSKIPNSDYENCDAIFIYESDDKAIVLWVMDTSPYKFVLNSFDTEVTKTPTDFKADVDDPRDYYCTYTCNGNAVTFNSNGTADFKNGDTTKTYKFAYVNDGWLKTYVQNSNIDAALILYDLTSNDSYIFEYIDNENLKLNLFEFTGPGSEPIPDTPSGGGNVDDTPSGGGNVDDTPSGGGNNDDTPSGGGNDDDTPSGGGNDDDTPSGGGSAGVPSNWEDLFVFDNVTMSSTVAGDSIVMKINGDKYKIVENYDGVTTTYYSDGTYLYVNGSKEDYMDPNYYLELYYLDNFTYLAYYEDEFTQTSPNVYTMSDFYETTTVELKNGKIYKITTKYTGDDMTFEYVFTNWGSTVVTAN